MSKSIVTYFKKLSFSDQPKTKNTKIIVFYFYGKLLPIAPNNFLLVGKQIPTNVLSLAPPLTKHHITSSLYSLRNLV